MKKRAAKAAAWLLPAFILLGVYFSTPDEIILTKNSKYSAYPNGFVRLAVAGAEGVDTEDIGTKMVSAKLFGALPIKTVAVSVLPERYVTVSGETIGVRIYSDGVMVVGVEDNSAAKKAGMKEGDIIKEVNHLPADSVETVSAAVLGERNNIFTVLRGERQVEIEVNGDVDTNGYTAGMWIRDSAAGIGTRSFVDEETGNFGALGHAICDSATEQIVPLDKGSISPCRITSVKQGERGEPGELIGSIGSDAFGTILANTAMGLYGKASLAEGGVKAPVATRFEVKEGAAEVLCDVDGEGVKSYSIEIEQISKTRAKDNKSMVVKITDPELIEKTGGIVQGMSGAPILQNGRFAGAVTHVFVNDPTRGYAVFAESMIEIADAAA